MNKKNGRPKISIDWKEFEKLCFLQCTLMEMCEWFHVTDKTLEHRVKEHYGETFSVVFAKKRIGGIISLRRNLFKLSEKNAAVAIFLAKNWLGMADKQEVKHSGSISNNTEELSDEELTNIIASRRSKRASEEKAGS